jgi:threonyl-tRNA synthetase
VVTELAASQIRADIDDRDESVDKRVREAELNWVPYIIVVGKKEAGTNLFAVRRRQDGKQYNSGLLDLEKEIGASMSGYPRMPLKLPVLVSERPGYKQLL